jgi:hypothetical protein
MKFLAIMIVIVALVFQNAALAQTTPATAPTGNPDATTTEMDATCPADWSIDECCSALDNCSTTLRSESASCTAQLNGLAQTCGYKTHDEALAADCRSRHGTLTGNECVCEAGRQWNNAETKACCVTNPAAYERRRQRCEDSRGTFRCSQRGDGGWCSCPLGTFLNEDGECEGEAVGRQRIQEMRDDVTRLTAERDRLETRADELEQELQTAAGEGDQLHEELEAARRELARIRRYLNLLRDILASHGIEAPSENEAIGAPAGSTPSPAEGGATTPLDEVPGTREVAAQVAAESTRVPPGQLAATSEADEAEEKTWCEENPWPCGFIIAGAAITAAGLGVGLYEAFKPPPEVTIGFDYR